MASNEGSPSVLLLSLFPRDGGGLLLSTPELQIDVDESPAILVTQIARSSSTLISTWAWSTVLGVVSEGLELAIPLRFVDGLHGLALVLKSICGLAFKPRAGWEEPWENWKRINSGDQPTRQRVRKRHQSCLGQTI